jgi:hypothetical protein
MPREPTSHSQNRQRKGGEPFRNMRLRGSLLDGWGRPHSLRPNAASLNEALGETAHGTGGKMAKRPAPSVAFPKPCGDSAATHRVRCQRGARAGPLRRAASSRLSRRRSFRLPIPLPPLLPPFCFASQFSGSPFLQFLILNMRLLDGHFFSIVRGSALRPLLSPLCAFCQCALSFFADGED